MDKSDYITIPLTRGYATIVSPEDAELAQYNWCVLFSSPDKPRAYYRRQKRTVLMSTIIMERALNRKLLKGEMVDHISGDSLDNTRENLRIASGAENSQNSKRPKNNTSGYKGVTWQKGIDKWKVQIQANNIKHFIGYFDDPKEAHEAYKQAATELHGKFARFE